MAFKLCLFGFVFLIIVVHVKSEDYFLEDSAYNETCREEHPAVYGIYAEHDKNYGGCRYFCIANNQPIAREFMMVPNNTPCGRGKSCVQGVCHYLSDIANCQSALNSEQALIKVTSCRLKCIRDLPPSAVVHDDFRLPVPIFHREGLACQSSKYEGICLDGKCVRQRTRSVQPRETIISARTRKHAPPDVTLYVKIDHYCRERYQDPRESIVGKEVEMTRGCQYTCEDPDVWESSVTFKAPDDVTCDSHASKICNHGQCRHKEDVEECRISFNTTDAVIVTRLQDFPCSLKCALPLLSGWKISYEKRKPGVKCSNVYIRNGFCNKQGMCIQEPSY